MHGGWCWAPLVDRLTAEGHRVHTIDLPLTDQISDAAAVVELLDSIDGPKVLVGHSYGGLVISRASKDRTDIAHLVYVAALMLPADANFFEEQVGYPEVAIVDAIELTEEGNIALADAEAAVAAFYGSCDPAAATEAAAKLRTTSASCLAIGTEHEPWPAIETTYVVCKKDEAIHPDFQRHMSANAASTVEIDTDHSPFLSTPDELLAILQTVA